MVTCRWVVDRLAIYLAGELDTRLADKITAHLVRCGRCSRVARELAETNGQVESAFEEPIAAPYTLDGRVMAAVSKLPLPEPAPTPPSRYRLPVRLALAAGLVLAGFGLGRLPFSTRPELDVTAFAADHRATEGDATPVAPLPKEFGFPVYEAAPRDARLVGGRRCTVQGQTAAHLTYAWRGESVSLFELDARKIDLPRFKTQVFDGHCLMVGERGGFAFALWCKGSTHCVLMARTTPQKLLALASAVVDAQST